MDHDHSYKYLFSHPELVRDLLQGFVHEPWIGELDLATLERVNATYVTADLRERESDIIWRVRLRDRWIYVYLLIEFQSSVDRYMAVRLLTYLGLLYQDLIQGKQLHGGKLPPVLPLVLYNGEPRWSAPLSIDEMIDVIPGGLSKYRPRFQYLLLDEGHYDARNLPERNLVTAIFRLETSRATEDVLRVLENLIEWLHLPEQDSLRRAFTLWVNRVVFPMLDPEETVPQVKNLVEAKTMLAERVKRWTQEWKEEGLQAGLQEGRQAGLQEGRQAGLQEGRQAGLQEGLQEGLQRGIRAGLLEAIELGLSIKFGDEGVALLARIRQIEDVDHLRAITEAIKTAATLEEVEAAV